MIKGLEALKDLREEVCYFAIGDYAYPRLDTIEKELKENEQYKVIENDLGIDLVTLFKALREPVYVIVNDKIVETYCGYIGEDCKTISFDIDGKDYKNLYDIEAFYVFTKDYGKTWALTREELENG